MTNKAELVKQLAEDRLQQVLERQQKTTEWQHGFRAGYWQGYHDALGLPQLEWFLAQGIPLDLVDHFGFGYCAEKTVVTPRGYENYPSYTFPVRDPESWEVVNIQHRLVGAPSDVQKYRQEDGIPASAFHTLNRLGGKAIVVEGVKKATVVFDRTGREAQVIGLPGMYPSELLVEEIASMFDRLWVVLDPGAEKNAIRFAQLAGPGKCRIASLPEKPDDAFLHGMTKDQFRAALKQARPI